MTRMVLTVLALCTQLSCGNGLIGSLGSSQPAGVTQETESRIPTDWDGTHDWADSALEISP